MAALGSNDWPTMLLAINISGVPSGDIGLTNLSLNLGGRSGLGSLIKIGPLVGGGAGAGVGAGDTTGGMR